MVRLDYVHLTLRSAICVLMLALGMSHHRNCISSLQTVLRAEVAHVPHGLSLQNSAHRLVNCNSLQPKSKVAPAQ